MAFIFDIALNFNISFHDKQGNYITSRKQIAKRYIRSWFFIDLLGCIPFQLIETDENEDGSTSYNKFLRFLRLSKFYKVLKVVRLLKMIKLIKSTSSVNRFLTKFRTNYAAIRLIYFSITILIIIHLVSCLWYYIATINASDPDTWISRYRVNQLPVLEQYLLSLYWVSTTLTTVGYGEFVPYTNLEKVLTILLMGFGVGFYSYVIGNVSNILNQVQSEESAKAAKLKVLHELAETIELPFELVETIEKHISNAYSDELNRRNRKYEILINLPVNLTSQISQFLNANFLKEIQFFNNRQNSFLLSVALLIKVSTMKLREIVYFEGDPADEMFFIKVGQVNLRANNGIIFRIYSKGSYFGECEILNNTHRSETVQVKTQAAVFYILSASDVLEMMEEHSDIASEIIKRAKIRENKHKQDKQRVAQLKPNNDNSIFSDIDSKLIQEDEVSPSNSKTIKLEKIDTAKLVQSKCQTEQNIRNKFLWQHVNTDRTFAIVRNTFIQHRLTNKNAIFDLKHLPEYKRDVIRRKRFSTSWVGLEDINLFYHTKNSLTEDAERLCGSERDTMNRVNSEFTGNSFMENNTSFLTLFEAQQNLIENLDKLTRTLSS